MSPLAPIRKWTVRAGIVLALVVTLPLVGLRGVAHADLGDEPSSKSSSSDPGQVEDNDKPKDLLAKQPADAAVEQQKKQAAPSTPFYEKWQFWAIAGGALVGIVVLVLGANALSHQINGGDVRPCNMDFQGRCFGEGR
jgi:hypothetical protein